MGVCVGGVGVGVGADTPTPTPIFTRPHTDTRSPIAQRPVARGSGGRKRRSTAAAAPRTAKEVRTCGPWQDLRALEYKGRGPETHRRHCAGGRVLRGDAEPGVLIPKRNPFLSDGLVDEVAAIARERCVAVTGRRMLPSHNRDYHTAHSPAKRGRRTGRRVDRPPNGQGYGLLSWVAALHGM